MIVYSNPPPSPHPTHCPSQPHQLLEYPTSFMIHVRTENVLYATHGTQQIGRIYLLPIITKTDRKTGRMNEKVSFGSRGVRTSRASASSSHLLLILRLAFAKRKWTSFRYQCAYSRWIEHPLPLPLLGSNYLHPTIPALLLLLLLLPPPPDSPPPGSPHPSHFISCLCYDMICYMIWYEVCNRMYAVTRFTALRQNLRIFNLLKDKES